MGMRILNAKKSKYYHEALENFEDAKNCYVRAEMNHQWDALPRSPGGVPAFTAT